MRIHLRILGWLYGGLAALVGSFALLIFISQVLDGQLAQAAVVPLILGLLAWWWAQVAYGLLRAQRWVRMPAILVAGILMVGLNILLLTTGGPPFSTVAGWIAFHTIGIAIGAYTLVVLAWPGVAGVLE